MDPMTIRLYGLFFYAVAFGDPGRVAGEVRVDVSVPQIPGGDRRLFARFSGRAPAIEDEMNLLISREDLAQGLEPVRRNVDGTRDPSLLEFVLRPGIDKDRLRLSVDEGLELLRPQVTHTRPLRRSGGLRLSCTG
jgi:hypothetical protein